MKQAVAMCVFFCVARAAQADEFWMTAADPSGTSSFNSAGKWSNAQAPSAGNTYRTAYVMRTPAVIGASYTFAGNRLTINTGSDFGITTPGGSITVNDLVLNGGRVTHSTGDRINTLSGQITVAAPSAFYVGDSLWRWLYVYSALSGTADLTVQVTDSLKRIRFLADNSAFTGKMLLSGLGKVVVTKEEELGGNPAAFLVDALTLRGVTLSITNSFVIDDANRGITINNTLTPASHIYPGAIFEVNAATLTVACAVSGVGPLTKIGTGTLILATNSTYTGLATVQGGTLRFAAGATQATSSVLATGGTSVVSGEGVLSNLTLAAGAQLVAENSGWAVKWLTVSNNDEVARFSLTLSASVTNTPLIRVNGPLVKPPFQKIVLAVSTNNLLQAPYQLLSASNLAAYAESDFYLYPPWAGELSVETDAGGGGVLLFTPNTASPVVFQIQSDPGGTSAFTAGASWSDGQAPSSAKTYVNGSYIMRTPSDASRTFLGQRLFFDGGTLGLKGVNVIPTIPALTMMNNAFVPVAEVSGAGNNNLAGEVDLYPSAKDSFAMWIRSLNMGRDLHLFSTLTGCGDLLLQGQGNPAYAASLFILFADSPDFSGRTRVDGNTNFWLRISGEEKLGGNPPQFRPDQLSFNGGGISVTNDVILDDDKRGILLLATGGLSVTDTGPGGFAPGTSTNSLRYEGGCTLRTEEGVTLSVNCPVTGPGSLTKKGPGLLTLGGENSYTGLTTVAVGSVRPTSPAAFGTSPVTFMPGTALQRCYSDTALTNGVEFGKTVTFEAGSMIQLVLDGEAAQGGLITLPLFLLPPGETIDLEALSVNYSLPNYRLQVYSETVGAGAAARVLVSAKLTLNGTVVTVR